ncbi:hypothetical protein Syun_017124 [Stephania yunnanensis]|uniref:Uncharacterized protein n=1 Tax=Stephania yunnanensis TaxID=152371 RepID=A0AAP0J8P3_9MAGN
MLTSTRGLSSKDNKGTSSSLEADSCIMVAEHELEMQESKGSCFVKTSNHMHNSFLFKVIN